MAIRSRFYSRTRKVANFSTVCVVMWPQAPRRESRNVPTDSQQAAEILGVDQAAARLMLEEDASALAGIGSQKQPETGLPSLEAAASLPMEGACEQKALSCWFRGRGGHAGYWQEHGTRNDR